MGNFPLGGGGLTISHFFLVNSVHGLIHPDLQRKKFVPPPTHLPSTQQPTDISSHDFFFEGFPIETTIILDCPEHENAKYFGSLQVKKSKSHQICQKIHWYGQKYFPFLGGGGSTKDGKFPIFFAIFFLPLPLVTVCWLTRLYCLKSQIC